MNFLISLIVALPAAVLAQHCAYKYGAPKNWFLYGFITASLVRDFLNKVYKK